MKKAVSMFLAAVMVCSLAACGSGGGDTKEPAAGPSTAGAQPSGGTGFGTEEKEQPEASDAGSKESRLVYGVTSTMSGDMGFSQWSSLGGDKPVIFLAEAMAPTCYDQDAQWLWDETIVASHDAVSNSDGTLTYTITLNEGLKFSDGSAISAKNYVAYPLLFSSPAAVAESAYGTIGKEFVGQQEYKDGASQAFGGISLVDDLTFSITVAEDYNPYYYGLALLNIFPIDYTMWLGDESADVADDGAGCYFVTEKEFNAENYGDAITAGRYIYDGRVCSGPYKIQSWDVAANEATLTINENYPGNFEGQKASIETIVVKVVDSATMLDALSTGSIDLIDGIGEGDMINACLDMADAGGYGADCYKYSGYMKLFYQCDWGPTQYEAVRKAITYLTDRESICQESTLGFGNVANGQYSMAQWMAQDMEEELSSELEAYAYNPDKAVELLKEDGWVYNEDGSDYEDGSGKIRYKKVPQEETEYMEGCVEVNGDWYMPLILKYCGHAEGEGIETTLDELLTIYLVESSSTADAGMKIDRTVMADAELLSYLNRRGANGEEKYAQPSYNMISLASGLGAAKFDKSGTWTFVEENIANNKNRYFNHTLDDLSNNMIYGVDAGDDAAFEDLWFQYQKEYNATLPETPLYNWTYCAVYNDKLEGFEETNIWSFQYAILYATIQ